jgi:putative chitinase
MSINRDTFFHAIRDSLFGGHFTQDQVDGLNTLLDVWEASGYTDRRWFAYMLATAFHETAQTMQPIHERGGNAYFTKMYDIRGNRPDLARRMGNISPGDGAKYCGRGYVQLTWRVNYHRMGLLLGVDLENNPDLAMQPDVAAKVMFEGMTKGASHVGDFTGVSLEKYFNATTEDWVNARRIINGVDCAQAIAAYAKKFNAALAA